MLLQGMGAAPTSRSYSPRLPFAPSSPPAPTLTPHSLSPGLCQSQAGGRRYVLLAGKESQSEREEAEMRAWRGCFFFFFLFPQPCSQRREVWGRGWGAVGGLQRTDNPSRSLVGRGSGPLLAPSASAAACAIRLCQPSAAQASGLGSQAEPAPAWLGVGLGCRAGSRKGSTALFHFSIAPLCPRSPDLSQPRGPDSARGQSLAVSSVPTSLPPPARGLLPALGSRSIRPCQPQLLHASFPTPWLKAGGPSIWRGWLSAPAAPDPGSPALIPTPSSPRPPPQ